MIQMKKTSLEPMLPELKPIEKYLGLMLIGVNHPCEWIWVSAADVFNTLLWLFIKINVKRIIV